MVISPASLSDLSLRAVPEPLLFDPQLQAHRAYPARSGTKGRVSTDLELAMWPLGKTVGARRCESFNE
jgi:hypothetical protein